MSESFVKKLFGFEICRLCLKSVGTSQIFMKSEVQIETIARMIMTIFNETVSECDQNSQFVCENCLENITTAYLIKLKCVSSTNFFSKLISIEERQTEEAAETLNSLEDNKYKCHLTLKEEVKEEIIETEIDSSKPREESELITKIEKCEYEFPPEETLIVTPNIETDEIDLNTCMIINKRKNNIKNDKENIKKRKLNSTVVNNVHYKLRSKLGQCQISDDNNILAVNNETIQDKIIAQEYNLKKFNIFLNKCDINKYQRNQVFGDPFISANNVEKETIKLKDTNVKIYKTRARTRVVNVTKNILKSKGKSKFKCNKCSLSFNLNYLLKRHEYTHTTEKIENIRMLRKHTTKTNEVKKTDTLTMINHLTRKKRKKKISNTMVKCPKCPKWLRDKPGLKIHSIVHSGLKPYKCKKCSYSSCWELGLKHHMYTHTEYRPYKCDVCGKVFKRNSYLLVHYSHVHDRSKKYKCKKCSFSTTWLESFVKHGAIHSSIKNYKCLVCNKFFKRPFYLKRHSKIHTGKKPFSCTKCEFSTCWPETIKRHSAIHLEEKPYKCSDCGKCFKTKSYLRKHSVYHSGPPLFKCEICKKKFYVKEQLKVHNRNHHSML